MKCYFRKLSIFWGSATLGFVLTLSQASAEAISLPDVKPSYWAYSTIQWAVKNNIVNGYPGGMFKPNKQVSEAEFLMMLVRSYQVVDTTRVYKHWADPVYEVAQKLNWPVNGISNNPTGNTARDTPITRVQVANIISGASGVHFTDDEAIEYLLNTNLSGGKTAPTVAGYRGKDYLTRAEAVAFIKRAKDNGLAELMKRPESESTKDQDTIKFSPEIEQLLSVYVQTLKESKIMVSADIHSHNFKTKFNASSLEKAASDNYMPAGTLSFNYNFEQMIFAIHVMKAQSPVQYNFQDLIYYHLAFELQPQVEEVGDYIIVIQMDDYIPGNGAINIFKKQNSQPPSMEDWNDIFNNISNDSKEKHNESS